MGNNPNLFRNTALISLVCLVGCLLFGSLYAGCHILDGSWR